MIVKVITHPRAKQARIEANLSGVLDVYIVQPPVAGKANQAIILALANYFQTKKNMVILISGEKSRHKIFTIN